MRAKSLGTLRYAEVTMDTTTSQNSICSHHHSFALDNFFRRVVQSPKKILGPYLNKGDTVVDLGCGPGFFSLAMAELVGSSGSVFAVDLQRQMLDRVQAKLKKVKDTSALATITLQQCSADDIGLDKSIRADFVLAYYMVHETPDQGRIFQQVSTLLKPTGSFLMVEPPFHVNKEEFARTLGCAERAGLAIVDRPRRKGGRSALFTLRR